VVTGATSGSGLLTLLGPVSGAAVNGTAGGLTYLKGALNHTGGLAVSGTSVYLGTSNPTYLAGINLNLSAGATLAANGANAYTIGNGPGTLSFAGAGGNGAPDSGGFSAIGGANTVTLNGGAALSFDAPNNPFQFSSIHLGSALSTHGTTLTNNLTAGAADIINVVSFGPQVNHLTGTVTGATPTKTTALVIEGVGTLDFNGTGSNYGGNLTLNGTVLLKIGSAAAFGDAAATKTISNNIGSIDLAGFSDNSTTHSWALGRGSAVTVVGNIFNSDTINTSTIGGVVTVGEFLNESLGIVVGGPGNINFNGTVQNTNTNVAGSIVFRGTGTYTIGGDFDNQATTFARNTVLNGNTLVFDNTVTNAFGTTGNERRITNAFSASVLSLRNGATFRLLGNDTANTLQNVNNGGVSINNAGNTIEVRSGTGAFNTTLALGAIVRASTGAGTTTSVALRFNDGGFTTLTLGGIFAHAAAPLGTRAARRRQGGGLRPHRERAVFRPDADVRLSRLGRADCPRGGAECAAEAGDL